MKNLKFILLFSFSLITFASTFYHVISYKYEEKLYANIQGKVDFVKKNKAYLKEYVFDIADYDINQGDLIKIEGHISEPFENTNANLFNYKKYLLSKKVKYVLKPTKIKIIKKSKNILRKRIEKLDNDYLYTLIMGENKIDDIIYDSYKRNGITHLFAISGMHISLLALIFIKFFNLIFKNNKLSYILTSFILIFYSLIISPSASILRSVLLFVLITINKSINLKFKDIEILLIIFLSLLIYNPFYIYDVGFKYSFTICAFLMFFKPKNLLYVSLLCFIVGIPITINSSYSLNLLSPLINILFVPIMSFILFPLSLATVIFPNFIEIFNLIISFFEKISILISNYSFIINFKYLSILRIVVFYIGILFFLIKKKYIFIPFLIFITTFNIYLFPRLTMIDVGQGDSFLIELPFKLGNILIDTGGSNYYDVGKNITIPFLKSRGINKIDFLILSHGDLDHMGAANDIIKNFNIKNVITNSYEDNELEKNIKHKNILKFSRKEININGYKFNFINSKNSNENEDSLIIYTELNNHNILFMGDAAEKNEKELLQYYNLDNINILKVGHHGSKTSTSEEFIKSINPQIALISVAKKNIYKHPSSKVISILEDCDIYKTSENGSTEIIFKNNLSILTCR